MSHKLACLIACHVEQFKHAEPLCVENAYFFVVYGDNREVVAAVGNCRYADTDGGNKFSAEFSAAHIHVL